MEEINNISKRRYYPIGSNILFGSLLGNLREQLGRIHNQINKLLFAHNFLEHIDLLSGYGSTKEDEKEIEQNQKSINGIKKNIKFFNENVENLNKKFLDQMSFFPNPPKLEIIQSKDFLSQLDQRFSKKYKDKEPQELANELLKLKIKSLLDKVNISISNIIEFFSDLTYSLKINLSEKYKKNIQEAASILSIGCSETAVFVAGRTIEGLINDLLINEIKKSTIQEIDLKTITLENKIGKLKSIFIIKEKEFHILQKLKFDGNDFGHPFEREISFDEAKRIILDIIDVIQVLEQKLK